jgi:hypothetical protein
MRETRVNTGFFYSLTSPNLQRLLADHAEEAEYAQVTCPVNKGHYGAGKRLTNLSVMLPGHIAQDIAWTWLSDCLLTDRVLDLFKSEGFTGFDVKPVRAAFKSSKERPPRIWELVVTGWAGVAPPESGINLIRRCDGCGLLEYSGGSNPDKLIDATQWDGSDFFMVWPLPKYIFISERVAQAIRANRLTGAVLRRPGDIDLSGGFGPGRLSYYMPEERAKELGKLLGID